MLAATVKTVLGRAARTAIGRQVIFAAVIRDPRLARFRNVADWPETLAGFEDLAFLFANNQLNHGIVSQQIDEASLLYRLVKGIGAGTIVEIGRFKGGSTFLIAAAMAPGGELYSYDVHAPVETDLSSVDLDAELETALARYGLRERVRLIVGDSRVASAPDAPCDLVFIDGDHSYDAVSADWRRWSELVRSGGHILLHDAVDHGGFGTYSAGVARLVAEIERRDSSRFARQRGAGATAHFVRR